jgi:uncharacterized protein
LKVRPDGVHEALFHAKLLVSDSQSMSMEAAMMGTPSIRYSGFAGRIGVLRELEEKYRLTFGIQPGDPSRLYDKIDFLIHSPDLRGEFQARRMDMLRDKVDVARFMSWLIDGFPDSIRIIEKDPDYQFRFR